MKNSFFNPESWLWKPFGKLADFLILSALWIFSCIPIITIGSSFTALYDCSAHCVKNEETGMFSRYFRTLRRELIPGMLSFLLWSVIIGIMFTFIRNFTSTADSTVFNLVIVYAATFLLILVVGIAFWVFPLLSRFTFNIVDLNLTAFHLAIINLPRTIILSVCTSLTIWLCLRFWIPLMIAPGIYGFLSAHILEPIFKKYEELQETEDSTDNQEKSIKNNSQGEQP